MRCCGGSNKTAVWGVPGTLADKPPKSNFAKLLWEVREEVDIGFEPASVQLLRGVNGTEMQTMLDIDRYYNGRFLEIKRPDLVTNPPGNKPVEEYVPAFVRTAAATASHRVSDIPRIRRLYSHAATDRRGRSLPAYRL